MVQRLYQRSGGQRGGWLQITLVCHPVTTAMFGCFCYYNTLLQEKHSVRKEQREGRMWQQRYCYVQLFFLFFFITSLKSVWLTNVSRSSSCPHCGLMLGETSTLCVKHDNKRSCWQRSGHLISGDIAASCVNRKLTRMSDEIYCIWSC